MSCRFAVGGGRGGEYDFAFNRDGWAAAQEHGITVARHSGLGLIDVACDSGRMALAQCYINRETDRGHCGTERIGVATAAQARPGGHGIDVPRIGVTPQFLLRAAVGALRRGDCKAAQRHVRGAAALLVRWEGNEARFPRRYTQLAELVDARCTRVEPLVPERHRTLLLEIDGARPRRSRRR